MWDCYKKKKFGALRLHLFLPIFFCTHSSTQKLNKNKKEVGREDEEEEVPLAGSLERKDQKTDQDEDKVS